MILGKRLSDRIGQPLYFSVFLNNSIRSTSKAPAILTRVRIVTFIRPFSIGTRFDFSISHSNPSCFIVNPFSFLNLLIFLPIRMRCLLSAIEQLLSHNVALSQKNIRYDITYLLVFLLHLLDN